jgi:hypothetical protein
MTGQYDWYAPPLTSGTYYTDSHTYIEMLQCGWCQAKYYPWAMHYCSMPTTLISGTYIQQEEKPMFVRVKRATGSIEFKADSWKFGEGEYINFFSGSKQVRTISSDGVEEIEAIDAPTVCDCRK